jgi:UDP-glucose 4-epimerase
MAADELTSDAITASFRLIQRRRGHRFSVDDLATAHLDAIRYLRDGGKSLIANAGYGHGYSVRDVLRSVEKIAGIKLDVREEPRRAGDPPSLVASNERVRSELGWKPRLDDLDAIVKSALEWERKLQREPW